jgi:hypothetical protein
MTQCSIKKTAARIVHCFKIYNLKFKIFSDQLNNLKIWQY